MSIEYGDEAAAELVRVVPEFRAQYEQHVSDYDELLLHLLVADLGRFVLAAERSDDIELVDRVLSAVERLFVEGDERTTEAVAVSFVELLGTESEPGEAEVVRRFPQALADELRRQRNWRAS